MKEDLLQIIKYFSRTGFFAGIILLFGGLGYETKLIMNGETISVIIQHIIYTGFTLTVLSIILITLPGLWRKIRQKK